MSVTFSKDSNGHWWKREYKEQCPKEFILGRQCQGYEGHAGVHWCYQEDGTFEWHVNEENPDEKSKQSEERGIAAGWTPPGHKEYVQPVEMAEHHYRNHSTVTEVTNHVEIEKLNNDEIPEDATVIKSLDIEEAPLEVQERYKKFREDMDSKKKSKGVFRRLMDYANQFRK